MNANIKNPARHRISFYATAFILLVVFTAKSADSTSSPPVIPGIEARDLLYSDDFTKTNDQWIPELESGGNIRADAGVLDIDVPAGATVWFRPRIDGPVLIEYSAIVVNNGGPNDRVSDLNCFWMARDSRSLANIFGFKRTGNFADYNRLLTYYAGLGGNANTTTRFRRYIGDPVLRPLRPTDDLRDTDDLLIPNKQQWIQLVADHKLIQFYRDGKKLFEMIDSQPYTSGWFAFRTTHSHLLFRDFRVYRIEARAGESDHP